MNRADLKTKFLAYRVEADSVADFLARYYKPERYTGRGEDYAACLLASHKRHLAEEGYDFIIHHDSITGRIVSFYGSQA